MIGFYLRLSISDGDLGKDKKDESNSIENQRLLLQTFLEQREDLNGEVREYVDDGYSGTNFERPGFRKMLEDAKTGLIDTILVKDLSRLGRDYVGVGDYLEQIFPILGVRFLAVNSNYDSNDYIGKTMGLEMSVTNLVNALYSKDNSKRIRTARRTKWKRGETTAGRMPFGYIRDKTCEGGCRIDPVSSEYVRLIFKKAIEGYNTREIAHYLNENDIPTPGQYRKMQEGYEIGCRKVTDKEWLWQPAGVWRLIKNLTYTGSMVHGKTAPVTIGGKARRKVPEKNWYIVEGTHPAIVTMEEFELAQEAIHKVNKEIAFSQDMGFSLRSKVFCGNCRLAMCYQYSQSPTLFCVHAVGAGKRSSCDRTRHEAGRIEGIVFYSLRQQIRLLNRLYPSVQEKAERTEADAEERIKSAKEEMTVLKSERIRQYEAYAEGIITQEQFLKKKKQITEKMESLQEFLDKGESVINMGNDLSHELNVLVKQTDGVEDAGKLTREMCEAFIDQVVVYDREHIEVQFLFDDLIQRAADYLNG